MAVMLLWVLRISWHHGWVISLLLSVLFVGRGWRHEYDCKTWS